MSKRALRYLTVGVLAAVFALAWRHELFLVVIAMPAAAIAVAVHARDADRSRARRAAALALVAPTGVADGAAVERIVAADLAALSMGDLEIIDNAVALTAETVEDPWHRALACERLESAKHMVVATPLTGAATAATWRRLWVRGIFTLAVLGLLAAVVATDHKALLVPLALAFVTLTLSFGEARRADGLRALLVRQATADPATGRVMVPDEAVVAAVRSLTSTNPRVRATASSIIEAWPEPERWVARRRVDAGPAFRARISPLDRDIAACGIAAAVFTAVLEAL